MSPFKANTSAGECPLGRRFSRNRIVHEVCREKSRGRKQLVADNIEDGVDYDALLPESLSIDLAGRSVHVLSLTKLVALKRASNDPKDKLRLPVLEATLQRKG